MRLIPSFHQNEQNIVISKSIVSFAVVLLIILVGSCSANSNTGKATYTSEVTSRIIPYSEGQLLEYLRNDQNLDPIEGIWTESSLTQIKYDNKLDITKSYNNISSTTDRWQVIIVKEDLKHSSSFAIVFYKQGSVLSNQRFGEYSTTLVKDLLDTSKYYSSANGIINGKTIKLTSEYYLNGDRLSTTTTNEADYGGDVNHHFLMKSEYLYQRVGN